MALLKEKLICLDVQQQNFGEYNLLRSVHLNPVFHNVLMCTVYMYT
jgi:hypothetical protein